MSSVEKILFITLSNLGDVILTLPAWDYLRRSYPNAKITVMTSERAKEIFDAQPAIEKVVVYHKRARIVEHIRLFAALKKEKFDVIVDLRNTLFGVFLAARIKAPLFLRIPRSIVHMRERHLFRLQATIPLIHKNNHERDEFRSVGDRNSGCKLQVSSVTEPVWRISAHGQAYVEDIFKEQHILEKNRIAVISPGAKSSTKRWPESRFVQLIVSLVDELQMKIVLVGDRQDVPVINYIEKHSKHPVINLAGKTTLSELTAVLQRAHIVITNDSAVLHLASYINKPVVALFGPTDECKYGPWSVHSAIVKKDIVCRPCAKAQCRFKTLSCVHLIKVEDVMRQVRRLLTDARISGYPGIRHAPAYKRILLVRTDRIGDVLLSTPAIQATREAYPYAYIAVMVAPYAKEIVEGNPYLDAIIIYDKDGKHRSWLESAKFAKALRKKKFDLAIILHPINRVHMVTFFAGIPERIGYNYKMGFLLTKRVPHTKPQGEKHESEYVMDLLQYAGIASNQAPAYMPKKEEAEIWADEVLAQEGIKPTDTLIAFHPCASCPSKLWPAQRFAEVADQVAQRYKAKAIFIAGPKDIVLVNAVLKNMSHEALNFAGKTSIAQLASLLRRCRLFISNDSGPVHIASAVGTPVIAIFGRSQQGLSPLRWGPQGDRDRIVHKEIGCSECFAHNCKKEFACLKAITVRDVLAAVHSILGV